MHQNANENHLHDHGHVPEVRPCASITQVVGRLEHSFTVAVSTKRKAHTSSCLRAEGKSGQAPALE